MKEWKKDELLIRQLDDRISMGVHAANKVSECIAGLLTKNEFVNIIFAAAPSQNEFLAALSKMKHLPWNRVNAFHMDEYIGLPADAPQTFRHYLNEHIFGKLPFNSIHYINGNATDAQGECMRYGNLLETFPTQIVCMGIGENGHIAFNDPHVADFEDEHLVKIVDLDNTSRQQQVHDGCFQNIDQVPTHALTLTIPALMKAEYVFCMVPGKHKAEAVFNTLNKEISPNHPSTILRKHKQSVLFIDNDSGQKL